MTENTQLGLKLLSGLLDYPGSERFWRRLSDRVGVAQELELGILQIMQQFQSYDPLSLEKLYVETFDFDPQATLYVTAHELGDSRDRGEALIELTKLYHEAGYEVPDDQLADYLPLLVELLALRPDVVPPAIKERVATVSYNIAQHLDSTHPYRSLLIILHQLLGAPTAGRPTREEQPDLADLPYPIEYQ